MRDEQLLERITTNPKVMCGKPVIRGTRLTVEYILYMMKREEWMTTLLSGKPLLKIGY